MNRDSKATFNGREKTYLGTVSRWVLMACIASATAAANAQTASDASADTSEDVRKLDTITVTSQRREESLQDVPAAISAYTADTLELAGIDSTRDLQLITPSLSFVQAAYAPQPTIRGIGARGVNAGDEQVVPMYIDGVYQPFVIGGIFELNNVERVEVLKGPQGILLGRNATGGAINIITKTPQEGFEGFLTGGYGSFDEVRAGAYFSGGTEKLAASLSAQFVEDDGYVKDIPSGEDLAALKSTNVHGKLVYSPSADTTVTFAASVSDRDDSAGVTFFPLNGNSVARFINPTIGIGTLDPRETYNTEVPYWGVRQYSTSLTVEHDMSFATLTSITGWSDSKMEYWADLDGTALPVAYLNVTQTEEAVTEDIYLVSNGDGAFSWIVGGFYMRDVARFEPRTVNGASTNTKNFTEAYAGYGQVAYAFDAGLTVTAGARYSSDEKCADAQSIGGTLSLDRTCKTWSKLNPSVSLDYKLNDATIVYGSYSTAFKSGVFNATAFDSRPADPENVKSYEVGVKSDLTSWLRVNAAAFHTDYDGLQVSARDPVTLGVFLQNAAAATISGVEGEIFVSPTDRLNVRAGFSFLDHEYESFPGAVGYTERLVGGVPVGGNTSFFFDAAGTPLVKTADSMASLSADYTMPAFGGDLIAAGNISYQGDFNWVPDGRIKQPSYAILNANLTWRSPDDRYEVRIWGKNLTDDDPFLTVTASSLSDNASYLRPRSVGISLKYNF